MTAAWDQALPEHHQAKEPAAQANDLLLNPVRLI